MARSSARGQHTSRVAHPLDQTPGIVPMNRTVRCGRDRPTGSPRGAVKTLAQSGKVQLAICGEVSAMPRRVSAYSDTCAGGNDCHSRDGEDRGQLHGRLRARYDSYRCLAELPWALHRQHVYSGLSAKTDPTSDADFRGIAAGRGGALAVADLHKVVRLTPRRCATGG